MEKRLLIFAQEPTTDSDLTGMAKDLLHVFEKSGTARLVLLGKEDFLKKGIRAAKEFGKCDVVLIFAGSVLTWGKLGTKVKKITGAKLIYDLRTLQLERKAELGEIYGDSLQNSLELRWEREYLSDADLILVHDKAMLSDVKKKLDREYPACKMVRSWVNANKLYPIDRDDHSLERFRSEQLALERFLILYHGELNLSKAMWDIVKAAEACYEKEEILFLLTGRHGGVTTAKIEEYCQERYLEKQVQIYENLESMLVTVNAADVVLVTDTTPVEGYTCMEQVYHAMAMAKPILGILDEQSEAAQLILRSGCGIICNMDSLTSVRQTIHRFYQMRGTTTFANMGIRGRNYLVKHLSRKEGVMQYASEIKKQFLLRQREEEALRAEMEAKKEKNKK